MPHGESTDASNVMSETGTGSVPHTGNVSEGLEHTRGNREKKNLLERVGIADGDCGELHGLKANGERRGDIVGEVGVDEDPPLPEHQGCKEQR